MLLNTTVDDSSPLISYEPSGGWIGFGRGAINQTGVEYHEGTFTGTWNPNASATFQFNGSSVSVIGGKRNDYGNFTVTLDGENTTLCNANSPNIEAPSRLYHMEMTQGWHTLVITKVGTNLTGMDIDSISWSSSTSNVVTKDSSSSSSNPPILEFDDDQAEFTWGPTGAWHKNTDSNIGRSTSVYGASVNFTFEGEAISLYGPVGPNFTSQYSVSVDGSAPRNFSARRIAAKSQMLYHADNLGSGNHTVVFTNWANGTTPTVVGQAVPSGGVSVRQADSEAQVTFGMHQAKVWKAAVTSASSSPQKTSLGTGAIAAISLGSVVFLSLVALLLLLNRRNKNLWALLHKGYKVQSQFDPDSPRPRSKDLEAASPNPPPSARAISFLLPSSKKQKNQSIEPYLLTTGGPILRTETSTHKRNRTEGSGGSGLYKPYAEFGKSRTKKHDSLESASHGADDADGDDRTGRLEHRPSPLPLPDPSEREIDAREPLRSDTLMTASTLVAEDGSEDGTASILDDKPLLKVLPEWHPTLAVHNNAKTPTESTASTRGTFPPPRTPSLVSSPKFSSIISAVRRSSRMSYASHFSRTRKRQTRSASPSQRHLLRPSGTEAHSDSEDYDEMDYEGADFYAQDAQGAVGVVRSSLMSLAATQWDAQTPIRGRSHDEEYDEASDFSRIQVPSWMLGSGNMSFMNSVSSPRSTLVTRSDSSVVPPESHRQTSRDTQFTLPVYASRTPSLDLPPPFTHP